MTVIDASALAKLVLKEDGWKKVTEHLKAGTLSVDHIINEVANAIWKRFKQGTVPLEKAKIMLKTLKLLQKKTIKIEGELTYMDVATEIAFSQDITIYDSLYIAMAKEKGLKLLTTDEIQAKIATAENVETTLLK